MYAHSIQPVMSINQISYTQIGELEARSQKLGTKNLKFNFFEPIASSIKLYHFVTIKMSSSSVFMYFQISSEINGMKG